MLWHPYWQFTNGDFVPPTPPPELPLGGKGDDDRRRKLHLPVKPTGYLERPQRSQHPRSKTKDGSVDRRLEDSSAIQAEISARLAREFGEETAEILKAQQAIDVAQLSAEQVAFEIGTLLRKKLRTEEDEVLLLLLLVAAAA